EIALQSSDLALFYEHQRSRQHVRARAAEGFNKTYGIVHPGEQWASNRDVRLSPFHARERELGAVFFEAAGWERPHWYESNAALLEEYGDRIARRDAEWDSRWWSPLGLWGPRARDILSSVTSADVSHESFPFATARTIEVDSLAVLASRISYVGDLGWELYVPIEQGAKLWDVLWEAGRPHGVVP